MSLNSALLAGASGLIANSGALAAISDNIANVNTIGYKRTVTTFDPLVKSASNTITYAAGGVTAQSRQLIDQQGILASSSSPTDVAISGAGFFVVTSAPITDPGEPFLFTRSGSFQPDEAGYLVNTSGYYLQGWPVGPDGRVNANPSDLSSLAPINLASIGGAAEATTRLQFNANLDSAVEGDPNANGPYAVGQLAEYVHTDTGVGTPTGLQPDFTTSVQVFDSLGALRTFTFAFVKREVTAGPPAVAANNWRLEVVATPPDQVAGSPALPSGGESGVVLYGDVTFDANGRLSLAVGADGSQFFLPDGTALPQGAMPTIQMGASDPVATGLRWANDAGAAVQSITLDFGGNASTSGLTQLRSPSAVISTSVDGSAFGDLAGVEIDPNGFVLAKFNNGVIDRVFQLPIATFQNPNGLAIENGGAYRVSNQSGQFTMKQPGVGGAGLISPGSLESSNVDLATEFTGLITTQRAYSAASKIITTTDEMLQELIQIIR